MRTTPILDPDTFATIHRVIKRAYWSGSSIPEALNREGLLWTPGRERQVRAAAIRFIADEMSTWTPAEFLRRRNRSLESASPAQMYMCIYEWVQEHASYAMIKDD